MNELLKKQKTTFISSLDENGLPQVSYSPYVIDKDKIYIYISKVAEHYQNMVRNKNVSLMIIEDESSSKMLFARKRVSFRGEAIKVSDVSKEIKDKFEEIHSQKMMETLYNMDFDFFQINLLNGRLVEGFGKAFDIKYENDEWTREHVVIDKAHNK